MTLLPPSYNYMMTRKKSVLNSSASHPHSLQLKSTASEKENMKANQDGKNKDEEVEEPIPLAQL